MSNEKIIKEARKGLYVKLEYDRADKGYMVSSRDRLNQRFSGYEFVEGKFEDIKDDLAVAIVQAMNMEALMELAKRNNVILPLFLYDHSILAMSTESFIGRAVHAEWDSGKIGWIHASGDSIKNEFGRINDDTVEKATERLKSEVKTYDSFLRGEAYGFKLFKDGEETDSCWGFIGGIDDVKGHITHYLSDEHKDLVDNLDWIKENEAQEYESEYEQEYEM